jgi:hypothetical protein
MLCLDVLRWLRKDCLSPNTTNLELFEQAVAWGERLQHPIPVDHIEQEHVLVLEWATWLARQIPHDDDGLPLYPSWWDDYGSQVQQAGDAVPVPFLQPAVWWFGLDR